MLSWFILTRNSSSFQCVYVDKVKIRVWAFITYQTKKPLYFQNPLRRLLEISQFKPLCKNTTAMDSLIIAIQNHEFHTWKLLLCGRINFDHHFDLFGTHSGAIDYILQHFSHHSILSMFKSPYCLQSHTFSFGYYRLYFGILFVSGFHHWINQNYPDRWTKCLLPY